MVNHGKEKARFFFSICSPTAAAFPELGELELSLPAVDLLSARPPAFPDHPLSLSRDSLPGAAVPAQPKAAGRSYTAARSLPLFLGTGLWPRRSLSLSPSCSRSNGLVHKSGSTSRSSLFRSSPSTTTAPPHAHRTRAQVLCKSALADTVFLGGRGFGTAMSSLILTVLEFRVWLYFCLGKYFGMEYIVALKSFLKQ
ncbi:uncharacterized protein LOC119314358 [Triticum dicoccoides]|uniref:uncharacterized protein LOC119314358 n=1 Tax=Triticum dicoccoides TaxID=85692 RepID=UPI001890DBA6|nr:uncharacterized protein LOC119314358 [Triticum dicoccoides]